jgi:hypothetical protein
LVASIAVKRFGRRTTSIDNVNFVIAGPYAIIGGIKKAELNTVTVIAIIVNGLG